ncbi:hypothetical protein SmJEL517_g02161 [Synchytrium microbalum]|uniref:TmcB/TmcC TPR repeats domain-containing protein n=1 Tax=Synchytrium microbalum TaxID=1806994 RepID=A0A507CCB0_9FUNG|nr:uncharacterized protein SmJEL517_g02161 [Synchytrium microbalum]TPX35584.1 hypothetical protein SmJEL517_g02161 [Synchytrium microbalum]
MTQDKPEAQSEAQRPDESEGVADELSYRSLLERVRTLVFAVLFYGIYGNSGFEVVGLLGLIAEDVQLVTFFLCIDMEAIYWIPPWIASTVQRSYENMAWQPFISIFGLCCATIVFSWVNALIVAWGFIRGQHKFILPIRFLRLIASVLPTMLFLPLVKVLIAPLICGDTWWDTSVVIAQDSLATMSCSSTTRIVLIIAAVFFLILLVCFCWVLNGAFLDINPTHKAPLAKVHGRADIIYSVLKTCVVCVWKLAPESWYLIKIATVALAAVTIALSNLYWLPFYNPILNHIRVGGTIAAAVCGLISFIAAVRYSPTGENVGPWYVFASMIGTYPFSFFGGCMLSRWYHNSLISSVRAKLAEMKKTGADTEDQNDLVFRFSVNVEQVARFATAHMSERKRQPDLSKLNELLLVFRRGLLEFPNSSLCRFSMANYLYHLSDGTFGLMDRIRKIEGLQPPSDLLFQVYFLRQMSTQGQEADFLGSHVKLDIASYAEFKKVNYEAKFQHQLALQWQREMWTLLKNPSHRQDELENIAINLHETARLANTAYLQLVTRFPKSKVLLRYYAQFLFDITNESYKAATLLARADAIEDDLGEDEAFQPEQYRQASTDNDENGARDSEESENIRSTAELETSDDIEGSSDDPASVSVVPVDRAHPNTFSNDTGISEQPNTEPASKEMKQDHSVNFRSSQSERDQKADMERRSEVSKDSTVNSEMKSYQLSQSLRTAILSRNMNGITIIVVTAFLIGVTGLGVLIANYIVITDLLSSTSSALISLSALHTREDKTALCFRRARQLQDAHAAGNPTLFATIQSTFYDDMVALRSSAQSAFDQLDRANSELYSYWTTSVVSVNMSYFPAITTRVEVDHTLYEVINLFADSGVDLATRPYTDPRWGNLSTDNSFRYIADNFFWIQKTAYDYSMNDLFFAQYYDKSDKAVREIIGLTVTLIATAAVAILVLDYRVVVFRRKQREALGILSKIPRSAVAEMLQRLDETAEEDIMGQENLAQKARNVVAVHRSDQYNLEWRARLEYISYLCFLIVLSVIFASFNAKGIYSIGQYFAMLDQFGDSATFPTRAVSLINELQRQDWITWGNESNLRSNLVLDAGIDNYVQIWQNVLYGDETRYPPSPVHNQYASDIQYTFEQLACLPTDQTVCNNRVYNTSIPGYSSTIVTNGLKTLMTSFMADLEGMVAAAAAGPFIPDADTYNLMNAVFEPDILDGFIRLKNLANADAQEYFAVSSVRNNIIFAFEVILVCLGQVVVFHRMVRNLRNMEECIADVIVRLPLNVRNLPVVTAFLEKEEHRLPAKYTKGSISVLNLQYAVEGMISGLSRGLARRNTHADELPSQLSAPIKKMGSSTLNVNVIMDSRRLSSNAHVDGAVMRTVQMSGDERRYSDQMRRMTSPMHVPGMGASQPQIRESGLTRERSEMSVGSNPYMMTKQKSNVGKFVSIQVSPDQQT